MMQKTFTINCATIKGFYGVKSIPPGALCPCIVIMRVRTWVPWLLKGLNIRYNRAK